MNQFKYKSWNVESLYRAHFASSRFEITKMKHLGIVHNNPKSSVFSPKSPRWFIWSAQNRYLRLRALYRRKKKIENIGSKMLLVLRYIVSINTIKTNKILQQNTKKWLNEDIHFPSTKAFSIYWMHEARYLPTPSCYDKRSDIPTPARLIDHMIYQSACVRCL